MVWFHGSAVQEPEWGYPEEFDRMRCATMSRHTGLRPRPQGQVVVRTVAGYPITDGLEERWSAVNDDILTGVALDPSAQVLLTVFDDLATYERAGWPRPHTPVVIPPGGLVDLPGIDTDQPLAWANRWGAGRCVTITLGQDWDTFHRIPFLTVLARGVEWAATGAVSLDPPDRGGESRWRVWSYFPATGRATRFG